MNVNRKLVLVLPVLTAALLMGHSSALVKTDSGKTIHTDGRANAWADALPKEPSKTIHTDGNASIWAS